MKNRCFNSILALIIVMVYALTGKVFAHEFPVDHGHETVIVEETSPTFTPRPNQHDVPPPPKDHFPRFNWGGYVELVNILPEYAYPQGVGDSGVAIGFLAEYTPAYSIISTNIGVASLQLDDHDPFDVVVEDYFGDYEVKTSDVSTYQFFVDVGPKLFLDNSKNLYLTVRGGYLFDFLGDRSISECDDCPKEEIEFDGGAYTMGGLGYDSDRTSWKLAYKKYLNGHFDDAVQLGVTFSF